MTAAGLQLIVQKESVVATHMGEFVPDAAAATSARYLTETQTFVTTPVTLEYQTTLIDTLLDGHTAIACLVAPFGYGKTSTAINLWQACDDAALLAVPPFSCNSIAEMGQAIASALVYRFEHDDKPGAADAVQDAYKSYLVSSAQHLAEKDAERYAIEYDIALRSIEDKIEGGYLQVEASGTNLLRFLDIVTRISIEAGYRGLVVIVDEFQQFLGNINKAVITNFRTLIWGLRTRGELPLGFVMTMDPDTERNLIDRGADILHRIRKDGLYMAFADIYDREFPRELWTRYSETFGFLDDSQQIVDNAALEAIGQICERPDLSNGPRTVINAFQRIATVYAARQRPYSPLDLIDDFLTGDIKFDGDRGKISSLVNELTSYDYVKRVPARIETLKLIAAFPRGCPAEVAAFYGLEDTFGQLLDELRGEVLLELPEGIALIDLQRVGKPQNKLNIILKKYWMQITEAEIIADRAKGLFASYAVAPLFPPYVSISDGWRSITNGFQLTETDSYFQEYEGTFFSEYPHRHLAVQVCSSPEHAVVPHDVDAHLVFVIQSDDEVPSSIPPRLQNAQTFVFPIAIHRPFNRHLPRDIRDIEDYLSPVVLTPGVLVSLLDYINQQLPLIEGMSEQERQRIEDKQRKLQEFLLVMIFSDQIFEQHGIQIFSRGAQAVRDALFQVFRKTYPRYQTLITTPAWRQTLDTYQNVLAGIDIAERRGLEPLVEKKADLARAFEQRSHAGFESYARKFEGLMRVADWRGDTGEIEFTKHPAENLLIEVISADNGLATDQIYVESRRHGYLPKEVDYLLAFLELRGYIEAEDQGEGYRPAHTLSHTELLSTIHAVIIEAKLLKENLPDEAPTKILTKANNLQDLLDDEQADLADAQVKIIQLQRETRKLRPVLVQASYGSLHHQRDQLYSALQHLGKPIPESDTGLQLDKHINGASRHIAKTIRPTVKQLENLREQVVKATNQEFDIENANVAALVRFVDILHDLSQSIEVALSEADKRVSLLAIQQEWVYLIDRIRRLEDSLQIASQVTNTTVLEQRLENTVSQLKQELATIGLENYQGIYDEYNPVIAALNQELAVFVSVGERISSEKDVSVHTDDPSSLAATDEHTQANGKTYIRKQLATHEVSLQQAFEHSNLSAQAFLAWLFTLQSEGALDIQISGIDEDQA